jgi:hypothetical protein
LVFLSSDDDSSENSAVNPPVDKILTVKTELVEPASLEVLDVQPIKRKRLSLIDSPTKSPKEKREWRRARRDRRKEHKGEIITNQVIKTFKVIFWFYLKECQLQRSKLTGIS